MLKRLSQLALAALLAAAVAFASPADDTKITVQENVTYSSPSTTASCKASGTAGRRNSTTCSARFVGSAPTRPNTISIPRVSGLSVTPPALR